MNAVATRVKMNANSAFAAARRTFSLRAGLQPFAPGFFRGSSSYERYPMRTRFLSARP